MTAEKTVAAKTNAARFLDRSGIAYELRAYAVDELDLSAETVARKVGLPEERVFKTLVARGDRSGVLLAVVPANAELDGKTLARVTGDRRVETVPLREVQPLTGHVRGGVTALGLAKRYPVYLDESAFAHDRIAVSAGIRGVQILLAPADYARASGAVSAAIARPKA
jgi:Cys-tRNA(Pro)/Cys-tRNA(Cys) deacylase